MLALIKYTLPFPFASLIEVHLIFVDVAKGYTLSVRSDTGGAQVTNRIGIYQQLLKECRSHLRSINGVAMADIVHVTCCSLGKELNIPFDQQMVHH
jgi:hypothetical protein